MNKSAKQYLQKINKQIICPSSLKGTFLRQLEDEVFCFCDDHDNADMPLLVKTFGSPEEVAEEFMSNLSVLAVNRCTHTRKKLLSLTFGVILTALIFVTIIGVRTDSLQQKLTDEKIIASVTYETESGRDAFWLPFWYMLFEPEE